MNYADKLGVPFVLFLGEDEVNAGVVTLKNMKSGEQEKLSPADAADKIAAYVDEQKHVPSVLDI